MREIKISYNEDEEMMEISLVKEKKNECIFHGNYWDFERTPQGIKNFLKELKLEDFKITCKKDLKSGD